MAAKRKTVRKGTSRKAAPKKAKSTRSCTVSDDFYKTMRGCKNGVRTGSYGKLNYRSVKVD